MLFIIQQFVTLLKLLHAEGSDKKIALAFVLGFFLATSPVLSLQGVLLIAIALFFRVQFGAFLFSWLICTIVFIPFAGLFDQIGYALLSQESLRPFYTWAQQSSILASTRFYNTVVSGGLVVSVLASMPLYFAVKWILMTYREKVVLKLKETKMYHLLKSSALFKVVGFYEKYKGL